MKTLFWGVMIVTATMCPVLWAQAPNAPAAAAPTAAAAPNAGQQAPDLDEKELNELIETVMAARLSKELKLTEDQTVLLVRRLTDLRDQMAEVRKQRAETVKELRAALKAEKPDEVIQPKLDQLIALDQKSIELRRMTYERAAENMTLAQRAKVYVFLSEFPNEMRRLAQKARERAKQANGPDAAAMEKPQKQDPQPGEAPAHN